MSHYEKRKRTIAFTFKRKGKCLKHNTATMRLCKITNSYIDIATCITRQMRDISSCFECKSQEGRVA